MMKTLSLFFAVLLLSLQSQAAVFIPGSGGSGGVAGSSVSNIVANMTTNIPVFGAVYGTAAAGTNGQPYTVIFPVFGVNTNVSTNASTITVQKDGFYQVGAVVSLKATNNDTFFVTILTNGTEHTGLRSYLDYAGATAGAALKTNQVATMGLVYALSNTTFSVQIGWHLAAVQALTNVNRAFFVNKINSPPGGSGGAGSGTTETQWIPVAAQFATNSSGEFVVKNGATVTNLQVFGLTNNLTFRNTGAATFSNTVSVSGNTMVDSLRITNATEAFGAVTATNGNIKIGNEGMYFVLGEINNAWFFTNNYVTILNGENTMGNGAHFNIENGTALDIETGGILNVNSGGGLKMNSLTANRVAQINAGNLLTNHPDMRLAASLSGAADTEVLKYHAASGTWTNGTDAGGSASSDGGATAVQFAGAANIFQGTNRFVYLRSDNQLKIAGVADVASTNGTRAKIIFTNDSLAELELNKDGFSSRTDATFAFRAGTIYQGYGTNYLLLSSTGIRPAVARSYILGLSGAPFKESYLGIISGDTIYSTGAVHSAGIITGQSFSTTNASPGSAPSQITVFATNLTQSTVIQGANEMSKTVTNIVGLFEVGTNAIASQLFTIDCNKQHRVNMTNRIGFAFTAMITNAAPGQVIAGRIIGEPSGSTSRVVTFAGNGLFLNSYDMSVAPATSMAVTVTNGYLLEYSIAVNQDLGTNTLDLVYAYKKY